jgi:hypothetical protein
VNDDDNDRERSTDDDDHATEDRLRSTGGSVVTAERSTVDRVRVWSGRPAERPALDDSIEVDDTTHRIEAARDVDQQSETRPAPAPEAEATPRRRPEGGASCCR